MPMHSLFCLMESQLQWVAMEKFRSLIDFFQKSGTIKFKIKDSRHKVKAEAEAFASVSIGQREDFKAFNKSEGMFNNNALFALEPVLMFLFGSKFFQL